MKFLPITFFLILCTLVTCRAQVSTEQQHQIDQLFKAWDNPNTPGAAIGVIQNGEIVYSKGYGMSNLDYKIPLTKDSKFYIASIAKQFTAACVALLAVDGELDLDQDIRLIFPELPDYGHKITTRNLIHHTSGLRDYLSIMYLSGKSFEDYFNNEDGIDIIKRQKGLNYTPNEEYLYSNSNYILLAELVKRVSGLSLREYADQKIFSPLGMKNTFFNDNHAQITENRVISYRKNEDESYSRFVQNFDGHGDGGMISTINDLFLWDQNFYHKKVGGEALQNLLLSRRKLNNDFLSRYSFGIEHGSFRGLKINMHGGSFLGFNHHFTRFPDHGFSVIILSNINEVDPYFCTDRISDIFLSELYEKTEASKKEDVEEEFVSMELSFEELSQFEDSYWNFDGSFSREIYVQNDTLRFDRGRGNISSLVPVEKQMFKMLVNGKIILNFDADGSGKDQLTLTINDAEVYKFEKYIPASYKEEDLQSLSGKYYSPEFDCTYEFRVEEGQLLLYIDGKSHSSLNPVMKGYFSNTFAGSIVFIDEDHKEFVVNSGRVRGVKFIKQ